MVLLAAAGYVGGALNAVAGGGSLVTFPALLAVGYPAVTANVTNTVALWPGYLGGVLGYRPELAGQRPRVVSLSVTAVVGAVLGCVLLLTTTPEVFEAAVPFLVLLACLLFGVQPRVGRWVQARGGPGAAHRSPWLHLGVLLGGLYGAYFGAGLGVLLLGVLGLALHDGLQRVNALRTVLSLVVNTVALIAFAVFAPVAWLPVLLMAATTLLGGFSGAGLARRLPPMVLRVGILIFGLTVGVVLLIT